MLDISAYFKAREMPAHATPPARMVGGDAPRWNADMDKWMDDMEVEENETYNDTSVKWNKNNLTVLRNPAYKSADSVVVSGEIG